MPARSEPLKWFTTILVVATCLFLGLYVALGNWRAATVLAALVVAGLLTPGLYRWTGSMPAAAHYFAAISFGTVVSMTTLTGGLYSPAIAWLVTAPVAAMMLNGPRTGGFWLGVVVAELILISLVAPGEFVRMQTLSPDGHRLLTGLSLLGLAGCVFAALLVDHLTITAADRRLHFYATHDGLTGLLNHRVLLEVLDRETATARANGTPLSLIMIDVDHFKTVNDRYGHIAGDRVLEKVARRITRCLRPGDIVGRYGGEEFLCILPDCPLPTARQLADATRQSMQSREFIVEELRIPITISLGVAGCAVGSECDSIEALRRADGALYSAKRGGRNRTCADTSGPQDLSTHALELAASTSTSTPAAPQEWPDWSPAPVSL